MDCREKKKMKKKKKMEEERKRRSVIKLPSESFGKQRFYQVI
jgi:hypothetical protein